MTRWPFYASTCVQYEYIGTSTVQVLSTYSILVQVIYRYRYEYVPVLSTSTVLGTVLPVVSLARVLVQYLYCTCRYKYYCIQTRLMYKY